MIAASRHEMSRGRATPAGRDLTRRDFLAAAGVGLIACARGTPGFAGSSATPHDESLLYVGTYTEDTRSEGIYLLRMNSRTGQLRRIGAKAAGVNPSFLTLHPNGRVLYAVNEVAKFDGKPGGGVRSFTIAGDGSLSALNAQNSGGAGPCYLSVDASGRVVMVANYDGGSVAVVPVQSDGSLAPAGQVLPHVGRGPNAERQEAPHAHCIVSDPSNRFALSADLGADRVFLYRLDNGRLQQVDGGDAIMRPGSGPRHIVFHPRQPLVFVANELDSTVATLRLDAERGMLRLVDAVSTIPRETSVANYPADIHIAPSGRTLYVSNRGHNSIAVFAVADSGALTREQLISTTGDWPRNFCLDPTGRWLLVANQKSDSIVVLRRDESGGLAPTSHRIELPSPVCLQFARGEGR